MIRIRCYISLKIVRKLESKRSGERVKPSLRPWSTGQATVMLLVREAQKLIQVYTLTFAMFIDYGTWAYVHSLYAYIFICVTHRGGDTKIERFLLAFLVSNSPVGSRPEWWFSTATSNELPRACGGTAGWFQFETSHASYSQPNIC